MKNPLGIIIILILIPCLCIFCGLFLYGLFGELESDGQCLYEGPLSNQTTEGCGSADNLDDESSDMDDSDSNNSDEDNADDTSTELKEYDGLYSDIISFSYPSDLYLEKVNNTEALFLNDPQVYGKTSNPNIGIGVVKSPEGGPFSTSSCKECGDLLVSGLLKNQTEIKESGKHTTTLDKYSKFTACRINVKFESSAKQGLGGMEIYTFKESNSSSDLVTLIITDRVEEKIRSDQKETIESSFKFL